MYQSVGSEVIDAIGTAIGKPLYKRELLGKPKVMELEYTDDPSEYQDDEVEDLFELLKLAKKKHPELKGVATGAIASTYQKNRVEKLCARLGMVSLAYLWGRDQTELMQAMIDSGMESILIKVASFGLDPKEHLGQKLEDIIDHMKEMVNMIVVKLLLNFLEREVRDKRLWRGRGIRELGPQCSNILQENQHVRLRHLYQFRLYVLIPGSKKTEIIVTDDNDISPVAYLRIKDFELVEKD